VLASYTLSKSIDTGSTEVGLGSNAGYTQVLADSIAELRVPPLAPSDFDSRHTFSTALSWETGRSGNTAHVLLRNWALDGILRGNSAQPLNVLYQRLLGTTSAYNVTPDVVTDQPFWIADDNAPEGRVLNPRAFARPVGSEGTFPRNSLRAFPIAQLDVALRRRFQLTENLTLDARAEFFNVLNHPMFSPPVNLWGAGSSAPLPAFGKVTQTLNTGLGGGALDGGQAAIYAPGGPRSAQFSLKLRF
jgi:hypothetical protein